MPASMRTVENRFHMMRPGQGDPSEIRGHKHWRIIFLMQHSLRGLSELAAGLFGQLRRTVWSFFKLTGPGLIGMLYSGSELCLAQAPGASSIIYSHGQCPNILGLAHFSDAPSGLAGGESKPQSPMLIANAVAGERAKNGSAPPRHKPSAILSQEEVAALVRPDQQDPKPRRYLQTALMGLLISVLAFTVVFLWYTQGPVKPELPPEPVNETSQARIAMEKGHYEQALTLLGKAAALGGSSHLDSVNLLRAEVLLTRAVSMIGDQPEVALSDITSAMVLAPQWPQGLLQAGRLLIRLDLYEPALDAYLRALRIDPKLGVGWFNLGYLYLETNRYEQGIEAFRRTIELDSILAADAYVNLAVCQQRLGRQPEAVAALRQALKRNPNHQTALEYLAKLQQGEPQP